MCVGAVDPDVPATVQIYKLFALDTMSPTEYVVDVAHAVADSLKDSTNCDAVKTRLLVVMIAVNFLYLYGMKMHVQFI